MHEYRNSPNFRIVHTLVYCTTLCTFFQLLLRKKHLIFKEKYGFFTIKKQPFIPRLQVSAQHKNLPRGGCRRAHRERPCIIHGSTVHFAVLAGGGSPPLHHPRQCGIHCRGDHRSPAQHAAAASHQVPASSYRCIVPHPSRHSPCHLPPGEGLRCDAQFPQGQPRSAFSRSAFSRPSYIPRGGGLHRQRARCLTSGSVPGLYNEFWSCSSVLSAVSPVRAAHLADGRIQPVRFLTPAASQASYG